MKAQEFLEQKSIGLDNVEDARKKRIPEDEAWQKLKDAESITIAKGKKVNVFNGPEIVRGEVLQHAMGPSGNLRAPTFKDGNRFMIGFHEDAYADWFR